MQATRILGEATQVLDAAEQAQDPAALAVRVVGPEQELRAAAYAIRRAGATPAATGAADDLTPQTWLVPRQSAWPRWFVSVTQPGADRKPSMVVLRSESARTPYRVWAQPSLLPGASLPATAAPVDGVVALKTASAAGLVASPEDVAIRYAQVLDAGPASPLAGQFGADAYRDGVQASTVQQSDALRAVGGSLTQQRSVVPGSVTALRTTKGGALVFAELRWQSTLTGPPGGLAGKLDPAVAALAGRPEALGVTLVRDEVLVFEVPPAGASGAAAKVQLLAAESGPVSATAT
jgi:hypothetical protein